jgi:hypothetical protein
MFPIETSIVPFIRKISGSHGGEYGGEDGIWDLLHIDPCDKHSTCWINIGVYTCMVILSRLC